MSDILHKNLILANSDGYYLVLLKKENTSSYDWH